MSLPYGLVVGDPIAHSLSPVIHLAAYRELGLDWDFSRRQVPAGGLAKLLQKLEGEAGFARGEACRGLSVTMPLKPEALRLAAYVDGLAKATGAVNTLVPSSGAWTGFNTDVAGIVEAFRGGGARSSTAASFEAVIFGSGATAGSAIAALRELGAETITVVSRSLDRSGPAFVAAERMFVEVNHQSWGDEAELAKVLGRANLVFCTVPGPNQKTLPLPDLNPQAFVLDAVYDPWPTPIASWAEGYGAKVIPGWEMLAYQGIAQVKLFTGREIGSAVVIGALENAIRDRRGQETRYSN